MDTLSFEEITYSGVMGDNLLLARAFINGKPIDEHIKPIVRKAARRFYSEYPGFNYMYPYADRLYNSLSDRHSRKKQVDLGQVDIMVCACGDTRCHHPVQVTVSDNGENYSWWEIRFRDYFIEPDSGADEYMPSWDFTLSPLFEFEKAQYESAMAQLADIAARQGLRHDFIEAYQNSKTYRHYSERDFEKDTLRGCYYCFSIFPPENNPAYVCYCGMDTVIGDSMGYPILKELLERMHEYWFKGGNCPYRGK